MKENASNKVMLGTPACGLLCGLIAIVIALAFLFLGFCARCLWRFSLRWVMLSAHMPRNPKLPKRKTSPWKSRSNRFTR